MAEAAVSDKFAQVRGFKVEITSAAGTSDVDTGWESVSGGELLIEQTETTVGSDKFQTNSPGHKTVGEITLRGAMTDTRAALFAWINETVLGKPWKRNVAITPIHLNGVLGETLILNDCALTAYVPPRLMLHEPNEPCPPAPPVEEVRFTYRDWTVRQ
ncbi:MAG: phage tail protein [Vicinamibacterales bacterium]